MWFEGILGRFCPSLSASLATVVSAGMEGEQSPFPAHTALAGAMLLCAGPVKCARIPLLGEGGPCKSRKSSLHL